MSRRVWDRREVLGAAAMGVAGLLGAGDAAEAQQRRYGPFRMGIQSYSLRGFKLEEALQKTQELGLRNWEAYSAHIPLTTDPAQVAALQEKLRAARVRLRAHGVTRFTKDAAASRRTFEAARALGVGVISADPDPDAYDLVNELVKEFDIKIAIHNHGPGHRYDKLQQVVDAVKGRDVRFGACVDTGHFLRSGEDPVRCLEALGERVHGVHLKDVKERKEETITGKGELRLLDFLKKLRDLNYREVLALEYELNPMNPVADLEQCLANVRAAVQML